MNTPLSKQYSLRCTLFVLVLLPLVTSFGGALHFGLALALGLHAASGSSGARSVMLGFVCLSGSVAVLRGFSALLSLFDSRNAALDLFFACQAIASLCLSLDLASTLMDRRFIRAMQAKRYARAKA